MKIKTKVNLLTLATAIILVLGLATGSYFIVLDGLSDIEEHEGISQSEMAEKYLYYKISIIDKINLDWAFWDHSYYFMDDKNSEYIEENLPEFIFENLNINSILYFDKNGSFFYGKYYNSDENEFSEIPKALKDSLMDDSSVKMPDISSSTSGFLKAGEKIYVVSINPVIRSDLSGPVKGTLVMVKEVSKEYIEEISNEINLNFELLEISSDNFDNSFLPGEKPREISFDPNGEELYIKSPIYGINGNPAAELKIIANRDLFRLGYDSVLFYSAFAVILCALIVILLNLILDTVFVRRIESFSSELKRIADTGDYSARLEDENDDEISSISDSANILLQTIEDSINSLEVKNRELKGALNKKSKLVAELHHRVKNNLQYIISLLGIKSLKIKDPKALEVINEATNRIKYLGMIHDDLYNKEDKESLRFKEHLSDLIKLILQGTTKEKGENISFEIHGDEFEAELSYAIPLSTALYELINNSTEHAFDENGGIIDIEISIDDDNLVIIVKDNGKGLGSPGVEKSGFGIKNARSIITKQLSGTLESINAETGTCWVVRINLKPADTAEK